MPNTAQVNFTEEDRTLSVSALAKGIAGFYGTFIRGPVGHDGELTRNWGQFQKKYGGFSDSSDDPLLAYRALSKGAVLRVSGVRHYTDITDNSTLEAVKAAPPVARLLTFSAALVSLNSIAATVNGDALAATVFATDNDTTLAAFATTLQGHAAVKSATVISVSGGATNDRQILVEPEDGVVLTLTGLTVTLGASQPTITDTAVDGVWNQDGVELWGFTPKHPGADYNNLKYVISNASNGSANYFNLSIQHATDSQYNESYENLTIGTGTTIAQSRFLSRVIQGSSWVDVTYLDLSAVTTNVRPKNGTYQFVGGEDGGSVTSNDWIGDASAQTGFYALSGESDMARVAAPSVSSMTVHEGGRIFAESRKDLVYLAHLDNSITTSSALITERNVGGIDSSYVGFYAGGLKIIHPATNEKVEISELADILAVAANSDYAAGEHYSYAGKTRGVITGSLGPVNNFGGMGQMGELNDLANAQINMVIKRDNITYLSGNFTAQLASSQLSYMNIRMYNIFVQKSLRPVLEKFLEQPNEFQEWRRLYNTVEDFLIEQKTKRAVYEVPTWKGDQDVNSLADLDVNNANDVQLGKYKIQYFHHPVAAINEIGFAIIMTKGAGVSFEDI